MKAKSNSKSNINARFQYSIVNMLEYVHKQIYALNSSKMFAGIMIIVLNIASRFVNIKLSRSIESYLKYTFSRQVLIFAITWMGTRDIYIAFIFSIVFMICVDFLFNEDSRFCCLPSQFTDYHIQLLETSPNTDDKEKEKKEEKQEKKEKDDEYISEEQIKAAKEILEKAKRQNAPYQYQGFYTI